VISLLDTAVGYCHFCNNRHVETWAMRVR
jgi:hypothetical protein